MDSEQICDIMFVNSSHYRIIGQIICADQPRTGNLCDRDPKSIIL